MDVKTVDVPVEDANNLLTPICVLCWCPGDLLLHDFNPVSNFVFEITFRYENQARVTDIFLSRDINSKYSVKEEGGSREINFHINRVLYPRYFDYINCDPNSGRI